MTSSLFKATVELLDMTSKEQWHDLADKVGCTYTWIAQLSQGKIQDPSVNKIEKLYIALGGSLAKL